MCHFYLLRFICECEVITAITPCKGFTLEGVEFCRDNKLICTFTDNIGACPSCKAARYDQAKLSRYNSVQIFHSHLNRLQQRQYNLTKAYEEIGKQYHRVPLGIRNDPRLPKSEQRVYTAVFHVTISPDANPWFRSWRAAKSALANARVEASGSLSAGTRSSSQAVLYTQAAEARLVAMKQYVARLNEVWRLRPDHRNTQADILQADTYIRRWLPTLTFR